MNSVTLFALLILTSTCRASHSDFTELDGDDFQEEFFEDEVAPTSSFIAEDEERRGDNEDDEVNRLKEIFKQPVDHPVPVLSTLNEGVDDKRLHPFLIQPFDNQNDKNPFSDVETKPRQAPKSRDLKDWKVSDDFFESDNIPWNLDAYYPKFGQNDHMEDASYLDEKNEGAPSVISGDYKEISTNAKHPQYFQKNYYYNYYPARWGWHPQEMHGPEETKKRVDNALGRKIPTPNPCKLYLEFLRYAFQRLDERAEYYYDPSEEYLDEWRDKESDKNRVFGTQLLGPTFYVDNSGKISQVNTNGNSVQVAEGISPDSRISVFSKTLSKPKLNTPEPVTQSEEATALNYSPKTKKYPSTSKPDIIQRNETETAITFTTKYTTRETERSPSTTTFQTEPTTLSESDLEFPASTVSKEVYYGRMGRPLERKPSEETETTTNSLPTHSYSPTTTSVPLQTTVTTSSDENKIKVKTMLSVGESTITNKSDEADCKDKMLPCPDTVNITYPLNGYCNRYVSCESGRAIRRTCPDGLHFNLIIKSCDLPHNSFCTYVCPQPEGNFGIPGDCGGYFVCKNSNLEYRMCPPKMHWDINKGTCTFSQLSPCPMKCFRDNEVRHYEGDCKAYIVCLNGIPYYHKCPPNTKFDKTALVCVPDETSNCVDDPRLLTNTLNPNTLCKDVQLQLNTKSWCRSFLPFDKLKD